MIGIQHTPSCSGPDAGAKEGRPGGGGLVGAARPHATANQGCAPSERELAIASEEVKNRAQELESGLHWLSVDAHSRRAPPPASARAGVCGGSVQLGRTMASVPATSLWQHPGRELSHRPDEERRAGATRSGSPLCPRPDPRLGER